MLHIRPKGAEMLHIRPKGADLIDIYFLLTKSLVEQISRIFSQIAVRWWNRHLGPESNVTIF